MQPIDDVCVIMPCYNEDLASVIKTYSLLGMAGFKVIIVDDGSHMEFPDEMNVITYPANVGYGYAIKQGIKAADTPYIITADADGQHRVEDVEKLYKVFKMIDNCAMIVGCRWNLKEQPVRWFARKVINLIGSLWAKHLLVDLNSGLRMFKRELAINYSPILCDTFSFTTSLTMSLITDGYKIAWFPIDVQPRNFGKSRVKLIRDGFVTLFYIFYIGAALNTRGLRAWLRKFTRSLSTQSTISEDAPMEPKVSIKDSR